MRKNKSRILAGILTALLVLSMGTTAFAGVKNYDSKRTNSSEFGTLVGNLSVHKDDYHREIVYETTISKLSSTSISTKIIAGVEVRDYLTGGYRDYIDCYAINKTETSYYWANYNGQDPNFARRVSGFGTHEARRSGSAVVYTEVYGI